MADNKSAAIIMAGGRGERLRPITDTMPKPNLEVGGIPALGYALRMVRGAGLRRAIVTVQYRYEDIIDRFGDEFEGVALDYYIEDAPLGTAGSVRAAIRERFYEHGDECPDEVIVLSGDAVCDFDLRPALSRHRTTGADATLLLAASSEPWKYGCVTLDGDGRVIRFIEKPRDMQGRVLVNTGIYILSRRAIERIPPREYDFGRDLFPSMVADGCRIYGFAAEGYWCDIGAHESYRRASFDASKNMIRGVTASVSPTGAVVAPDCRAGAGSSLPGCVLGRGVTVGVDVRAEDSILCRGVTVGDGVHIGPGSVIGEGAFIATGSVLPSGTVIMAGEEIFGGSAAPSPASSDLSI